MVSVYLLVGAGGTGSILYQPLMRYLRTYHGEDTYIVGILDGDSVETKNLERQLFPDDAVTENKALALTRAMPDPAARPVPEYLGDDNVAERIKDGDTVLIAADNYQVRQRIEARALELDNVTVINGGNELLDGSCQVFIRRDGRNVTPPLSWLHPEILSGTGHDPSAMSCAERAAIPGGEQTIIANMQSATLMLNTLRRIHAGDFETNEVHFDLVTQKMRPSDTRVEGWLEYAPA